MLKFWIILMTSSFLKKSFFYLNIALTLNVNIFLSDHFVKKMKTRKKKRKFMCNPWNILLDRLSK